MKKLLLPKKMALYSKKITRIHEMQKTHISRMSYMCFSNIEFVNRILKYYLEFAEYSELSGSMIFLNLLKERKESSKEVQNFPPVRLQSNGLFACNLLQCRRAVGLATHSQMSKMRMRKQTQRAHKRGFCECRSQVGCSLEHSTAQVENFYVSSPIMYMVSRSLISLQYTVKRLQIKTAAKNKILFVNSFIKNENSKEHLHILRMLSFEYFSIVKEKEALFILFGGEKKIEKIVKGQLLKEVIYGKRIENWLQEKRIYRNEVENWLQRKYIYWNEIKNWLEKKQIKQYGIMSRQLGVGSLASAKQRAKWTYLHAHLADACQFVVRDLVVRNEAKKSRMQEWLFKFVRSYEEKKYRSLIGHVAVGKDIYFGKIQDRMQSGGEGKSDKFFSQAKFSAESSSKWNSYPMVNFVKVQREWYSGGILGDFWLKLAWDINRIEKISPVRLDAPRSIQPDFHIRKSCAYVLFASAYATAQIEKFVQVREKGYANGIIDLVKYQIGRSLNARNSCMAERKMLWQKNSWKEEVAEEEKHLWEKEINFLSLYKDRDTGRKLGNWSKEKWIYWNEIKNWLEKKQIKRYEIENLSQINLIPAKQRAKWTCLHIYLATPARQRAKWAYLYLHLADACQFVVGDLASRNEAKKSHMQKRLFKSVRDYEKKQYKRLIGHVAVGKDVYFGKVRDRIQSGGEGKSDKFFSWAKFSVESSNKWNIYSMVNFVKVQREWYSGGILGDFWLKLAWGINRIEKIPPVRLDAPWSIQPDFYICNPHTYALFVSACATVQMEKFVQVRKKGYANRIIDFVKYQIGKSLNARNSRMAERKKFWQKNSWKEETEEEKHLWEKEINFLSLEKDRDTGRKLGNWSKEKRIYWNEIGSWSQKKYIYWNEIKNWFEKKQIKQYGIESLSQINFIPAEQRAKWTCLHVHLADAARVKYPCCAGNLMPHQLAVGDLTVRNEAIKSQMQKWLFKSVRSYEEKKYRSLIGHVAVGKDVYFGKIQDRMQSGGEGKSDKFSSRAKFSSKSTRKWNAYPIVNSVKVQAERHSGGILGDFLLELALNINRIEKIPPVQLDAPRSIQPDFYIRKIRAYALFASAYVTAQIEKFVQVREKGYANRVVDFVKYQIERSLNARNSRMAERKMLWQKNSWKEEVAEEEKHLWEKEIIFLSLEKDRDTGRKLGNWSKEKRIYWNEIGSWSQKKQIYWNEAGNWLRKKWIYRNEIGNWSQKKRIYRNEIGSWSRKKQIYQNEIGNWLQKKYIYWNEIKNWLEKKQIKQYGIESLSQINFIPANQRAKWTCLQVHLATAARVKYPCCAGNLIPYQLAVGYLTPAKQQNKWVYLYAYLADVCQFVVGDLAVRNEAIKSQMQKRLFKFVRSYEEKKYRSLIGPMTVGKDMYSGKIQDRIQSGGEGKSDKFSSRAKFSSKATRKRNAYPIINSVKVQTERHFGGILGAFWLKLASNINRLKKIPPVQIQEKGYANWIIDFVKCRIGRNLNARNNRIAERKMLLQKNNWRRGSEQLENQTRWHDIESSKQENVIVHGKFDVPSVCCRVFGWNYALRQKKLWGLWSIYESGEKEKWINTISIRVKQYFNEIQNRMHSKKGRQINQIINLWQSPNEEHDNQATKNNPFVRLDALRSIQPNSHIRKTRACMRFVSACASTVCSFGSGVLIQRSVYPAINCMQTKHRIAATQAENNYSYEAPDQIDILAYTFDLRQNDIIYVRKNDLEKQALLKVHQKIQNIEEKFQENLTREEQKNRKKEQALEMLEEKVAQQDKKIQELTAANMELQRKMREDRNGQGQEDSYFEILNNDMKLERMRYGIIDF